MQKGDNVSNNETINELETVEIVQENQIAAMTDQFIAEHIQISSAHSTFGLDVSCSDDDEVSEVDSFILDPDDQDAILESNFLLPQSMDCGNLHSVADPDTHAKLEALLEAAGIGKLSTADGKALTDPEVLRKLTSSVNCALDEAAQALHRMRAEQSQFGNPESQRSLAEACSDGDVPTVRKLLREGGSVHETTEEGDSLLSLACSAGYYELAQVLLAMKANVEDRGIKGDCTPLMEAASGGYVDIVKLLIAHGTDVNAQSSAGNTPLHYAACGGYEDVVQVLIEAGANVEQHNENGHTPLMEAASAGHVGVAAILLNNGAGINTHSNEFKESALTLACYKGHLEMVKFLLEAGADQEHKTDEMHTALMEASMDGHVEVARVLLDSGAQVNMPADSFESPLTLAACGGHVELADLLIARGANMEEVNDEGYTPLMEAAREGHEEMVALLLAHNADINAQTEETQETALTLACCGGFQEVADFLITAGADIELGCSTPLMEAAQEGHLELVKYLLKCNAKVNAPTGTGDTALTYACENGHTDVADVLLQYGAELEHESEGGRTPLMKAARAGHICTVQFLISKGADVNRQTTTNDHTVLSLSCAGGHQAVVELLLAHGADPTHKLKDGSTMVIEAAKGGHTQVVKMLLEYPNRVLLNPSQDLTQIAAVDSHHIESRVPIHGLANIVPPSEPDSHSMRPNNVVSTTCEHFIDGSSPLKKKVQDKEIIIQKAGDQIWQNMQKSLKRSSSTGNQHNIDPATKSAKTNNLMTSADLASQITENDGILSDFLPDDQIDLKAGERLEAIISNVMAKELINTTSTREEQILRKQQILEELQKVEQELQEKAQQQLLITAQHQQQQQQQFQKALQYTRQPLHKALQKQLEEQKKNVSLSSQSPSSLSPADQFILESQMSINFDQQVSRAVNFEALKTNINPITSETMVTSSVNNVVNHSKQPGDGAVADKQKIVNQSEKNGGNGGSLCSKAISGEPAEKKIATGNGSVLGTVICGQGSPNGPAQCHNGGNQSSQMINQQSQPLCQVNPMMSQFPNIPLPPLGQAPPKPPQLTLNQLQQLQIQQQQQQTVLNQQFVLNENQRQTLQNFILHHQQEAQQFAQPTTPQYSPIQLTQDHLLQVFSQQQHQFTVQQLQQAQHTIHQQQAQYAIAAQQQQQLPHQGLLQQTTAFNPAFSQAFINPQQQQQILQQQQQAQLLQQQLQQIKSPLAAQIPKPTTESKAKCMLPMGNQEVDILGIETITPPPSTPLTPNPSPASPSSISPQYSPIDLDAQTESNHDTALTLACAGGHSELVTLLLSKGADIEHRDKKGFTPLILAATAGHTDVVEILLEQGADIEAQSERTKDTPLSLACSGGRYEVVELLLSRGANKEHRNVSDYTPLSLAASGGFVNIIKLLLSHGAEINSRTGSKLGISPLMLAAMNGHTAAVKLLLDMGSDINAQIETNRNTALTLACFQGRHEVVSLLVDRKANIEHRAKTGLTPLMEAASGGYVEVGRVLLDKGADVNAPPVPSSRDTALTIAADKGHYRFVELLLSRHSVVDVKNKKGNSPLWLACNGGHLDVVQLLVTAGADIDSQDNRKVSCLMAAFRKGHIKVVKWMVKHVNQFPSDAELSRYIATITDKELQKKCQQCMEIIVSAKDQQAAEANKNATDLLEELDKERQEEESRRAAAAKKRERKKKKKKLKLESVQIDPSEQSNCKNSTPEPESEDSQQQEAPEVMVTLRMPTLVIEAPVATTTSTLGLTLLQETELSKISKPFDKKPEKRNNRNESESNIDLERFTQDENKDPRNNKTESGKLGRNNKAENTSKNEARKNKKNRKDREKLETVSDEGIGLENDRVPNNPSTRIVSPLEAEAIGKVNHVRGRKKMEKDGQMNCTTAIGDLDDFGNLPSISDKDIEKLRKNVEKSKISPIEKTPYEKAMSETSISNMMSIKSSQVFVNSPKRGPKKEDGWKEVIRKSKKVQVPASAISRVIGRGGCNIKAVREISGANIDVEKNKGSGDRTITIKGSAEATRQAHALIMALISDPDKELSDIVPKPKQKQPPVENKSLYFIPPTEPALPQVIMAINQSPVAGQSKASNKCLAPRLQQQAAISAANQSRDADVVLNAVNSSMVWASSPAPGSVSTRRNTPKGHGSPYSVQSQLTNGPTNGDKPGVTRQLFGMEKRSSFGNANSVTATSVSTMTSTTHASSCFSSRTDVRLHNPSHINNQKTLVPGTVKLLQRPSGSTSSKHEPQPLPIVPNQLANTVTTHSQYNNGLNMSSSGEFSPFDNLFSNAAVQLLGKKEDGVNERMNFANVAAAGVLPAFSSSFMSQELNHLDPALQARAPGFKLPFGPPRMSNPLEVQSFMQPQFRPPMYGMPMVDFNMMGLQDYHVPASSQSYPNQSPDVSPRSSQSSTASLSPRSNSSGFEPQLAANQKEEYTTPNQPMTLPKISSSLNPNAPDFTSRSPASPFPPNYPTSGVTGVHQFYPPEFAKQFMSSMFNVNSASFNPSPIMNPGPGNQDPLASMSTDQHEFFQNMTNLMHQFATVQTNMPGSPVLGAVYTPPLVTRPYSPLAHQGRPNSAPSVGGLLPKDNVPQSVIGPPHVASPRLSTPPPMPDGHVTVDDRRQLRPIGGERSARKPMGPPPGPCPDYGDAFWTLPDWNSKMTLPSMTSASLQTSVMSTSVMASGTMVSNPSLAGGDSRMMNLDNSSFVPPDDVSDQRFPHFVQSSGLQQVPPFNGVLPPHPTGAFGGGTGDGLHTMWSSPLETCNVEDVQKSGMWNWSK